jgi:hypothetical protein
MSARSGPWGLPYYYKTGPVTPRELNNGQLCQEIKRVAEMVIRSEFMAGNDWGSPAENFAAVGAVFTNGNLTPLLEELLVRNAQGAILPNFSKWPDLIAQIEKHVGALSIDQDSGQKLPPLDPMAEFYLAKQVVGVRRDIETEMAYQNMAKIIESSGIDVREREKTPEERDETIAAFSSLAARDRATVALIARRRRDMAAIPTPGEAP